MLKIEPIPAFSDNYIWLLTDSLEGGSCVVDPGDAGPVIETLEARGLELTDILVTHHHPDHVGGLATLVERYQPRIHGPVNPAVTAVDNRVREGDLVEVLATTFEVMEVPGHTLDHIAYFHGGDQPLLFCGDTLFAGGCGRLFEGTPEQMYASLQKLAALPPGTRVYCAHEYTLANLAFAAAVEPDNAALRERIAGARALRAGGTPTVPSELGLELATNPFLRCDQPALRANLSAQNRLKGETGPEVFATVRHWKDHY